ncbi:hypothetical protein BC826DRAFT_512671 [Russula brevipes]|nr:hypothetical protein BC826DRAFT_512671 [Russula brevipes]
MYFGKDANFRLVIFFTQYSHALLTQFSMRRSRGEPLLMWNLGALSKLISTLGLGTQEDRDYLSYKNNLGSGPDVVARAEAILTVTLRDGPMSNFYRLGRVLFEVTRTDKPDSMSNDIMRAYALLRRIVDTRNLPLIHASEEWWSKFDHLRVAVHGTSVALGGGGQNVENIQPLLDILDEVGRMRLAAHYHPEGTGEADDQIHSHASLNQPPLIPSPHQVRDH